ncbi:MAG: undecaprenyl-diphosphatase UppP [Spirochaetaceae bacterium]|nr:undecaprenyl-diphosphatase UppP [Spirochaetaceae bacterium]
MLFIQSIVLGIVQGLAEFIPVSSSAHLVIVPWLFSWSDGVIGSLSFDVALHMGTLAAVIAFFAKDWVRLIAAWFRSVAERRIGDDRDRRMAWYLLAATIPGGLAGVLFEGKIEELFHPSGEPVSMGSMLTLAAFLAAMGALLFAADKFARHDRDLSGLRWRDALIIGCAQAAAIVPGVSRSGATMTAGLALGLERAAAARFSFLLSAPIIAGAGLKNLVDLIQAAAAGSLGGNEVGLFAVGFVAAAVSGFFCIKLLLGYLQRNSVRVFAWYRWALAILVAVFAFARG